MLVEKFFHLDCTPVIPECGYQCKRCIEEIFFVLEKLPGVAEVATHKQGDSNGISVRYHSETINLDDLLGTFRNLPSMYAGFFKPSALDE